MTKHTIDPPCAHCGMKVIGYSSVGVDLLCHPDAGMDCYRLVTVYHHDMPCNEPACLYSVQRRFHRENNTTLTIDDAIDDVVST